MGKQSREKRERLARQSLGEGGEETRKPGFQTDLEKICLFVIRWGTYLILFTPLIIYTELFFPFVGPKTIFFRIVVEIILAAYFLLILANNRYRPKIKNPLTIAITIFLAIFILTSFTGINLERSFWSTNERMTGIFTMLHLFAFFVVLSSVFKRREDWEKILGVSIIVGVIVSFTTLMDSGINARGGGTIGNTSFMAAYLLFNIFFAIALFLSKRGRWQIFSGISLLIMLPVLLTSTARGAIISFSLGLGLLILGYLIFSQKKAFKRLALGIVLFLIIIGISTAVFQPPFVKDKIESNLGDMKSRFVVWEKGWKGFQEKPILGWGPENFNNVFLKYFNPCMSLSECGSEVWFDRTHNIVLDTLVTTGIIGLLSYLAVFGVAIIGLLKTLPKIVDRKNIFLPLTMAVLLIVYFFQNLLVFDMINTYLVFFLTLAFISFLIKSVKTPDDVVTKQFSRVNPVLVLIIIAMTVWVFWVGNIKPATASYYLIQSNNSKYVEKSIDYFQKSLDSWMYKYEAREQFAKKIVESVSQELPAELKEPIQEAFRLAEAEMEKSIEQNYLDFRHHLFLGELYNSSYGFSGDTEKFEKAEQVLTKAIELSPTNQYGYWYLAETKSVQGKTEEMISLLQKAVDLESKLGQSHWQLALGYKFTGDYQLALDELLLAEKYYYYWWENHPEQEEAIMSMRSAVDSGFLTNYNIRSVQVYLEILESHPDEILTWVSLTATYIRLGRFEEAREAVRRLQKIDPDQTQVDIDAFIKYLPEE